MSDTPLSPDVLPTFLRYFHSDLFSEVRYASPADAMRLGMTYGMESPHDLTFGLSWDENHPDNNKWFDTGVNIGQNLMRLLMGTP